MQRAMYVEVDELLPLLKKYQATECDIREAVTDNCSNNSLKLKEGQRGIPSKYYNRALFLNQKQIQQQ